MLSIYDDKVKRLNGTVDVVKTMGYGHRVRKSDEEWYGKPAGTPVPEEVVNDLYDKDFSTAINDTLQVVHNFDSHPDSVKTVLVDMSFQLGRKNLEKFRGMLGALEEGNYAKAADEMQYRDSTNKSKGNTPWYNQSKTRAVRLTQQMRSASANQGKPEELHNKEGEQGGGKGEE